MKRNDWLESLLTRAANLERQGWTLEAEDMFAKALRVECAIQRAEEREQAERAQGAQGTASAQASLAHGAAK